MNEEYQIAVNDSLSGKTVIVNLKDKDIYDTYRRIKWNMDKNDKRHAAFEIPFSALVGGEDGAFENFNEFANEALNPAFINLNKEKDQFLHNAIGSLPILERQVIILLHFRNFSASQVAKLLEISEQAVNKRKRKAYATLNIILENYKNI